MITGRVAAMLWSWKKVIVAMACWRFSLPGDAPASVIGCQVRAVSGSLERFVASCGRGAVWKAGGGGPLLIVDRTTGRRRDPVPHGTGCRDRPGASTPVHVSSASDYTTRRDTI